MSGRTSPRAWQRLLASLLFSASVTAGCGRPPPAPSRSAPPPSRADGPPAPSIDRDFVRRLALTKNFTLGAPVLPTPAPDGKSVLFLRSGARDRKQSLFELDIGTRAVRAIASPDAVLAGPETLSPEERARRERMRVTTSGFTSFEISRDGTHVLLTLSGRVFVLTRATGAIKELPTGKGAAIDPHFGPNGRTVAYVRGSDVRVIGLEDPAELQVTTGGTARKPHGLAEFIAEEELDRHRGFWWSPDGSQILYEEADTSGMDLVTIADVAHPEKEPDRVPYPRPGRPNARVRFGIVALTGGPTTWIALDDARWPYVATVTWGEHGQLALCVLDRLQKNAQLLLVDTRTGATRPLLTEHDDAWLNVDPSVPRFLADGRFLWSSDRAGERRLELRAASGEIVWTAAPGYAKLVDVDERARRAVVDVHVDPTRSVTVDVDLARGTTGAIPPGPPLDTTTRFGSSQHDLSVVRVATPTTLARHWARDRAGTLDAEIPSVAEDPGPIPGAELGKVGPDDVRVAILRPRGFVTGRSYPVIDAAYGGPHRNMVQASPYLRDQWLADATGAIVVALDARGTERRGRAWERALAGRLGDVPLGGHVEALAALGRAHAEMDMSRVGIYGWSFGGYLAALATVSRPDVFKAGVAGAPVTEWRDYDSAYTERYLGLPDPEKAAYDAASVLVRAAAKPAGPARPLLLIHGTADDNVLFTHTLKLTDAMERAGRPFELMPLAGITHLPYEPDLAEALWTRVAAFLRANL